MGELRAPEPRVKPMPNQPDFRRFRRATLAPCLPSAVLTDLGRWAIVRFFFAAAAAFLMFFRAAFRCLVLAIGPPDVQ